MQAGILIMSDYDKRPDGGHDSMQGLRGRTRNGWAPSRSSRHTGACGWISPRNRWRSACGRSRTIRPFCYCHRTRASTIPAGRWFAPDPARRDPGCASCDVRAALCQDHRAGARRRSAARLDLPSAQSRSRWNLSDAELHTFERSRHSPRADKQDAPFWALRRFLDPLR